MEKAIFYKNLKFWGSHTIINAAPSFILAYIHEWNTAESIMAMILAIMLFTLMLTYFTSLRCTSKLMNQPIITSCIKVGTFIRMLICLTPLVLMIFFSFYYLLAGVTLESYSQFFDSFYPTEFITGLISHNFYRSIVDALSLSITDVRDFIPTFIITLAQGFLLITMLLLIGLLLSPIHLIRQLTKEQARL